MPIFSCLIFNFDSVTRGQLGGGINLKPRPEKNRVLIPLRNSFQNFLPIPPFVVCGTPHTPAPVGQARQRHLRFEQCGKNSV